MWAFCRLVISNYIHKLTLFPHRGRRLLPSLIRVFPRHWFTLLVSNSIFYCLQLVRRTEEVAGRRTEVHPSDRPLGGFAGGCWREAARHRPPISQHLSLDRRAARRGRSRKQPPTATAYLHAVGQRRSALHHCLKLLHCGLSQYCQAARGATHSFAWVFFIYRFNP